MNLRGSVHGPGAWPVEELGAGAAPLPALEPHISNPREHSALRHCPVGFRARQWGSGALSEGTSQPREQSQRGGTVVLGPSTCGRPCITPTTLRGGKGGRRWRGRCSRCSPTIGTHSRVRAGSHERCHFWDPSHACDTLTFAFRTGTAQGPGEPNPLPSLPLSLPVAPFPLPLPPTLRALPGLGVQR